MFPRASTLIAVGLAGVSLLAACSSDGKPSSAAAATNATSPAPAATTAAPATVAPQATTAATSPAVAATVPAATVADATTPPASTGGKLNINDASVAEMEAAFEAVGVTNPNRWAKEVEEYRPYPKDPEFAKLRQELGKYNIAPSVLELIVSVLEF